MPTPEENLHHVARQLGISGLSDQQLLQTYAAILEELRVRGIARTSNNPVADYTEWLVCSKLGLRQQANSTAGFDASAEDGTRFEIKSRRVTRHNSSVQLSAIRNLKARNFEYLIGVIYEADFSIRYAAKVPHELIADNSRFSRHSNAHFLNLTGSVLGLEEVEDITSVLAD
jgi:hypothetical protein